MNQFWSAWQTRFYSLMKHYYYYA